MGTIILSITRRKRRTDWGWGGHIGDKTQLIKTDEGKLFKIENQPAEPQSLVQVQFLGKMPAYAGEQPGVG